MNRKKLKQKIKKIISSLIVYSLLFFVTVRFYDYFKKLKKDNFYTLTADIKHTDELKSGAFVRLSGVDVGIVSKLELLPDFSVKVYMHIDNGILIPDDSSVAIYTDGLIGPKYIAILPGGSIDYMQNGDEFEFAQDSVNITEMIEIGIEQFKKSKDK
ncbi:MAG: MCE family protein [Alphaproteobacteria bacterium]|nr:MCE family protein [Alphaproteobacteria bacterium]